MANKIEFSINKKGNHVAKFLSPINRDNGYTNEYLGDFESSMELFLADESNNRNGSGNIEWVVEEADLCEHIGVWWEHGKLVEYDGVFELPQQAVQLLRKFGVTVGKDFLPQR